MYHVQMCKKNPRALSQNAILVKLSTTCHVQLRDWKGKTPYQHLLADIAKLFTSFKLHHHQHNLHYIGRPVICGNVLRRKTLGDLLIEQNMQNRATKREGTSIMCKCVKKFLEPFHKMQSW